MLRTLIEPTYYGPDFIREVDCECGATRDEDCDCGIDDEYYGRDQW